MFLRPERVFCYVSPGPVGAPAVRMSVLSESQNQHRRFCKPPTLTENLLGAKHCISLDVGVECLVPWAHYGAKEQVERAREVGEVGGGGEV